jgi:Ca2+-binding RTX toxin-like protein
MQVNNPQFQVKGTQIYNPQGQEFIIKGSNIFTWEGISNVDNYLNTWGFNTIRVPNYLLGSYNQPHPAANNYGTNHKIVDAYTSQGAVVIFDAHDRIGGYYENNQWEILKDYWRDMAREFKDNPYVWFNLHNEPGNATPKPEKWVSYHRELIDIIRSEGANNLIVVDGEAWGQDYHTQTIANYASEIMADNENIIFSLHVYEQWNSHNLTTYFDTLHSQNIPVIVGEYGSENNGQSTLPASQQMLQAAQEREIGRIVWAAKSDDNNDLTTVSGGHAEYFNGTNNEILTQLGGLVWNDLRRTENLTQLAGYEANNSSHTYTDGVFEVNASGQIQFDFLFDGGGFQGELGLFNLAGMETYTPGSIEFIQAATARALSNSHQGYVVLRDATEAGRFSGSLPWESQLNSGEYLGQKTFAMTAGTRFGLVLIQNGTIQEIANNPSRIWQNGKLPLFSMPEANFGTAAGQIVAVDSNGTFALEDVRVDWQESDRDYNDLVFQLQGVNGLTPSMNQLVDPDRDWRTTEIGQNILEYAANTLQNDQNSGVFTVGATGQVQFDFLFDGGWFQGELAIFSLAGMEAYVPGSTSFIQAAALRALSNSRQGHILMSDRSEGARFSSVFPWEKNFNAGTYLNQKLFAMTPGDRFGVMLIQNTTVQDLAKNPNSIWQWGKLPLFSMPEANPNGTGEGQMVAVDSHGTFAFEDVRVDLGNADKDYNDVVLQFKGAVGNTSTMDELVNPNRDWRTTASGQQLLTYAANASYNPKLPSVSTSSSNQVTGKIALDSTLVSADLNDDYPTITGGNNHDLLQGSPARDVIYGGLGNDSLYGKDDDDWLFGDQGNDSLFGDRGNDVLFGGLGKDTLIGAKGNDLFVLAKDTGVDTIEDFKSGQDLIQLAGNFQFEDLIIIQGSEQARHDVTIFLAEDNQLLAIVKDFNEKNFSIADFI